MNDSDAFFDDSLLLSQDEDFTDAPKLLQIEAKLLQTQQSNNVIKRRLKDLMHKVPLTE